MSPLKNLFMKTFIAIITALFLFSCSAKESASFSSGGGSGKGGSLARFTISGNYMYAVDKENLKVFNITNPAQPAFVRSIPVGFEIETIYPFSDKLFIGSTSVVHIFSIADPANPQKLSTAISPQVLRRCDPVVARDSVAYATLRTNGPCGGMASILAVYDIRNITSPVQVSQEIVSEPYGLGYTDNTLYVCDRNMGLMVFDITNAFDPVHVKNVPMPQSGVHFVDVIPNNDVLVCWVTKGMVLYDITDRNDPVLITEIY
jgi:hypothetical protein